jgi:hypothetical protein
MMALLKCKDCGTEVSTTAKTCPKCGWKVQKPIGMLRVVFAVCFGVFVYNIASNGKINPSTDSDSSLAATEKTRGWKYSVGEKDKMTGKVTEFAVLDSPTVLKFEFPYSGGSTPSLTLMRGAGKKEVASVLLEVTKGQFLCTLDCTIEAKFDDGGIQKYKARGTRDGTSNMIFVSNEKRFIEQLRSSKHLWINADFYKYAGQQMEFQTAAFKW